MNELQELWQDLQSPSIAIELAGLTLCFLAAWLLSWSLRRRSAGQNSILFGERLVDGVVFPALALVFTYILKLVLFKIQRVAMLKVVLPVLLSLVLIRLIAQVLTAVFPNARSARLLEQIVSWVAWGFVVLRVTGWWDPLMDALDDIDFMMGKTRVSVLHIFEVLLTTSLAVVLALWLSTAVEQRVLNRAFDDLSMRKVASNAMRVLLLVVCTLVTLSALGFDLTTLSVLGGALGVGIGFGLQKLAANYVSGFVILLERSLRIGDFVRVDGFEGRVSDIKTRYTLVRAGNGIESVVPNELLLTQRVENWSLENSHLMQTCTFWVGLDSDVTQVQNLLQQAAQQVDSVMASPAPEAQLADVTPQGLRFNLNFWMNDAVNRQSLARSCVNIAALSALRAAAVQMVVSPQEVVLRQAT